MLLHELLTVAEMGEADRLAVEAGVPSLTLMENAGRAVAEAIAARFKPCAVAVLCGPGNNGGDGFVAARYLKAKGFDVRVALLGARENLKCDAAAVADKWNGEILPLTLFSPPLEERGRAQREVRGKIIVDALFGAGLSRPLDGVAAEVVKATNESGVPIVAIDVPSGLHGDLGRPLNGDCIKAVLTVTFFRKKPAHVLMPGRALCGDIVVTDIGIPESVLETIKPQTFENSPALWGSAFPSPKREGHKYDRGHCVVVSGPAHATGAARLAARGALRIGAGLVSVASPPDAVTVNAVELTAIMVKPFSGAGGLAELLSDKRFNAVAIGPGCGVGENTKALVETCLSSGAAVVIDADGITSFASNPNALFSKLHNRCVLTPHEGEFERVFPGLLKRTRSRLEATRHAAADAGCVILLKGPDTIIAEPPRIPPPERGRSGGGQATKHDPSLTLPLQERGSSGAGRAAINSNAPPTLATAGAGDVLTGFVAGLMAQGMQAFEAACAAAWLHGEAAREFGPGLIAEDIPEALPQVLRALELPKK